MNSEELEMSLRSEFENHLKDVLADMRQEFSQFQEKIDAEFDKHKSQLNTVFQEFSTRFETGKVLDQGFRETVVEHLRLARDEGARITATAIAEAEEMEKQSAPPEVSSTPINETSSMALGDLRDAIKDITAQDSQGAILKSLVHYAAQYTPRGAFFIIKNEHFVGWRIFDKEGTANEDAVREVYLPVASESVLGESVRSLSAVESSFGTYSDDAEYLNQIGFGEPERMIAIPLVARGRGVAVLYADYGTQNTQVNVEALETLVRVAGLTVEVLAANSQAAKYVQSETAQPTVNSQSSPENSTEDQIEPEDQNGTEFAETESTEIIPTEAAETTESDQLAESDQSTQSNVQTDYTESVAETAPEADTELKADTEDENNPVAEDDLSQTTGATAPPVVQEIEEDESPTETVSHPTHLAENEEQSGEIIEDAQIISVEPLSQAEEDSLAEAEKSSAPTDNYKTSASNGFQFTDNQNNDISSSKDSASSDLKAESFETVSAPAKVSDSFEKSTGSPVTYAPKPAVSESVVAAPVRSRFGDRNVDLPIEVSEDERRLHNDARRFARLLVSEIKLYNEQKVKEGRESRDLYDRLREAIDRSREMYNKRVQPPVADKFDYFHYELVSTLAEGEETKLGGDYPGAKA